ncbi:MAG: hypothetical protein DLM73_11840 [Chthoniobacterales bacterium]|nr:MAG: hypothetical protein DLM73_11840 [Chthoniobacterales bacterium]
MERPPNSTISQRLIWSCAGLVFCVSLAFYGWTLAPTVTLVDSGELIVAARTLGVAHPPGFPLYLILAHLASMVPLGNVAIRVNFTSALFAALASATLTLVVAELMVTSQFTSGRRGRAKVARKNKGNAPGADVVEAMHSKTVVLIPAIASGLLLAFSRTLWSYATIAEVYTLNSLLILLIFFLMFRWRRRIVEANKASELTTTLADYDYLLYAAAFLFGLALGVHHVTVGLTLPALAIIVYSTQGRKFFLSTRLLYAAILAIAALLTVYSYLPLAASHAPILNWGDARSPQAIWRHMTGKQYQVFLSFAPQIAGAQLIEFGKLATRQLGPWCFVPGLFLLLAGLVSAFRRMRTLFWILVVVIACDLAYCLSYSIEEDKDAYYLPAFMAMAIAIGLGLSWLLRYILAKDLRGRQFLALALLVALAMPALAVVGNWPFNNRRHYFIAHDYVENILGGIEPNGLLLNQDWQVESPMLYTREIEGLRRDVKVVDLNLLNHSWYLDYLTDAYPELMARSRQKVDAFTAQLVPWENDPASYESDPARLVKISSAFNEMCQAFVTNELKVAPVYITSDLLERTPQNKEVTEWLTRSYQLVPRGLAFRIFADQNFHAPSAPPLQTRGLTDGTLFFEKDDVFKLKVLPVYIGMLVNRGRYLAAASQHEYAIAAFRQALSLDPNLETARQELAKSLSRMRETGTAPP